MKRKELINQVAPAILMFENKPFNHKQLAAVAGITLPYSTEVSSA